MTFIRLYVSEDGAYVRLARDTEPENHELPLRVSTDVCVEDERGFLIWMPHEGVAPPIAVAAFAAWLDQGGLLSSLSAALPAPKAANIPRAVLLERLGKVAKRKCRCFPYEGLCDRCSRLLNLAEDLAEALDKEKAAR